MTLFESASSPVRRVPLHISPRPGRLLVGILVRLLVVVAYRLVVAVAVAGTGAHAVLWWPQSLLLVLLVLAVALGGILVGREPAAA